jgi:dTDP-4-dehydrorhamnose 3,5-epimerase
MSEPAGNGSRAVKDAPHVTPSFDVQRHDLLEGVRTFEVKNIVTANGFTTEVFRPDWGVAQLPIQHVIHVSLHAGVVSAWHQHRIQTDHIFVVSGTLRVVLFDGREDSATDGQVNVFTVSNVRPTLLVVPPGVWHGVKNVSAGMTNFVNYFDRPYNYEDPDEWRLPRDTPEIPYSFDD